MGAILLERPAMARPKGRPRTDRDDVAVKLDRKLASMARAIVIARGTTMGEYLSGLTSASINRDYAKMLRERDAESGVS